MENFNDNNDCNTLIELDEVYTNYARNLYASMDWYINARKDALPTV